MSDMITGVVVLQKMPHLKIWELWFEYTRADGIIGYTYIPIKRKGEPTPEVHTGPLWEFVERSPLLDCTPSVRILGPHDGAPDHFHNQGFWTNPYVIMAHDYGAEPDAREVCQEINQFKTKEERDGVIFKYRSEGILL